jgi:hypothetical protein
MRKINTNLTRKGINFNRRQRSYQPTLKERAEYIAWCDVQDHKHFNQHLGARNEWEQKKLDVGVAADILPKSKPKKSNGVANPTKVKDLQESIRKVSQILRKSTASRRPQSRK